MRTALVVLAFSVSATASLADDRYNLLLGLGNVLAAEQLCDLAYDQTALVNVIDQRVAPDDLAFPDDLKTYTRVAGREQDGLSESSKAAHCAQVARLARTLSLIP
jgi:hypothetical protein